jgi:hypothetical protein
VWLAVLTNEEEQSSHLRFIGPHHPHISVLDRTDGRYRVIGMPFRCDVISGLVDETCAGARKRSVAISGNGSAWRAMSLSEEAGALITTMRKCLITISAVK